MIRDRGNIKWTAMMLPEHVALLREWNESDQDITEPEYDEFELNVIADELNIAYQSKSNVRIKYWINKRVQEMEGQIIELLPNEQAIKIKTSNGYSRVQLKHILNIKIYD